MFRNRSNAPAPRPSGYTLRRVHLPGFVPQLVALSFAKAFHEWSGSPIPRAASREIGPSHGSELRRHSQNYQTAGAIDPLGAVGTPHYAVPLHLSSLVPVEVALKSYCQGRRIGASFCTIDASPVSRKPRNQPKALGGGALGMVFCALDVSVRWTCPSVQILLRLLGSCPYHCEVCSVSLRKIAEPTYVCYRLGTGPKSRWPQEQHARSPANSPKKTGSEIKSPEEPPRAPSPSGKEPLG